MDIRINSTCFKDKVDFIKKNTEFNTCSSLVQDLVSDYYLKVKSNHKKVLEFRKEELERQLKGIK